MLYYVRITAEMSQILVSCEAPIQWEQFCLLHNALFMSLHGPAGAYILVASVSQIHVPPVQHVVKHCGAHKHIYIYNNI